MDGGANPDAARRRLIATARQHGAPIPAHLRDPRMAQGIRDLQTLLARVVRGRG